MQLQSLSVVIPTGKPGECGGICMNHCASCPGRMHDHPYPYLLDETVPGFSRHLNEYIKRLEFARHNGCNTVMLTGSAEPQQNRKFLTYFGMMQKMMSDPFQWVEMQTTGAGIDRNYLEFLRDHVGLNLLSLSLFALESVPNAEIVHPPKGMMTDIPIFTKLVKNMGLSLRLSLNMTSYFDEFAGNPKLLFKALREDLHADQVTFRVLYESGNDLPEDRWVRENSAKPETVAAFKQYVLDNGTLLGTLSYGAKKYGVHGMSTVIDDDSMGKSEEKREAGENYKYAIVRENCKIYTAWDDPSSLLF